MKTKKQRSLSVAISTAATLAAAMGPAALAGVNVQQFSPAANSTYVFTEDAMLEIAPKDPTWTGSRLFFSASYNWVNDPLIVYNENRTVRLGTLVDGIQTLDLGVGVFLDRRFSINFSTGLNLVHMPGQANQFALGDSRAFGKWRLTDDGAVIAVSLMPQLFLPTGSGSLFVSDGGLGFGAALAFEHDFGPVRAAANIGYRYSPNAQFENLDYTQRLPMSLGVFIPVGPRWGINAEAAGSVVLPINNYSNPNEVYGGARYQLNRDCTILGGVSIGGVNSSASNDFRASVGVRFSPIPESKYVEAPKPAPAPAPVVIVKIVQPAPVKKAKPRVVFTKKEIQISEEIKFENDSAVLTASGKRLLDEVAQVMKKNRKGYRKIVIEGHTNEIGSFPHNQTLSEQRAASVREYLGSRGITQKDLMAIGYGKTKPKKNLKGMSRDARLAANRRVEFKVIN